MAETPHRPDSANLEEALATLDSHLGYPPTPPIAARVAAHLRTHPAPQRAQGVARWLRLGAAAAALLLVLAGAGLLLSPEARSAVADRLGLPGVSITHTEPGPTPLATNLGAGLGLGERTTLAEARARSGFAVSAPTAPELGEPDEVFWGEPPRGGQVTLL
ncbi:MAG: hypothetical protein NTZ05_15360, partial [Chloroflexi bacterium]|nr:hypothetical protein [Chloroflexota bacterium]